MFRAAVIGCGKRGLEHAQALREAGFDLVACADPEDVTRQRAARRLSVPTFPSLGETLAQCKPEVLVLATPPKGRLQVAAEATAAPGLRALVIEKPVARTLGEARGLAEACEARGIALIAGHQLRYVQEFESVQRAIRQGVLGEVRRIRAYCYGNLLNQGPHMLDLVCWLAGERRLVRAASQACDDPEAIAQRGQPYWKDRKHPAPMWMTHEMEFEGGLRATVETGLLFQRDDPEADPWLQKRVAIEGSEGQAQARAAFGSRIRLAGAEDWRETRSDLAEYARGTVKLHAALREMLEDGTAHRCAFREARPGFEALVACAASAATGQTIRGPLDLDEEADYFQALACTARRPRPDAEPSRAGPAYVHEAPEVSVIVPLLDHRRYLEPCVEGWSSQRLVKSKGFEVIYLSNGRLPKLEALVNSRKRGADRLVIVETDCEHRMYHRGAREARANLLLFTEPHCVPDARCIEEVAAFMHASSLPGCVTRDVPSSANLLAQMEERFFTELFPKWMYEDEWFTFPIRGLVLRKEVYSELGGFESPYGKFIECVLAARLHHMGLRLGFAKAACITHRYPERCAEFMPHLYNTTQGECLFREHEPRWMCENYLPEPPEWSRRHEVQAARARSEIRWLLHVCGTRPSHGLRALGSCILRRLPLAVAGAAWPCALAWWAWRWHWLRMTFWRGFDIERMYRAYLAMYFGVVRHARWRYIRAHPPGQAGDPPRAERAELAHWPAGQLSGFYTPEDYQGVAFRWSGAVASLRMLVPRQTERVAIELLPLRTPRVLGVFWNERRVTSPVTISANEISFALPFGIPHDSPQELALGCDPLPKAAKSKAESRVLGLPVIAVRFVACEPPSAHARAANRIASQTPAEALP